MSDDVTAALERARFHDRARRVAEDFMSPKVAVEPPVRVEAQRTLSSCNGCRQFDAAAIAFEIGPAFMAVRVRLCPPCAARLRDGLATELVKQMDEAHGRTVRQRAKMER